MALLKRESLTMKVAGMEISVSEAARKSGEDLAALQERVACLGSRLIEFHSQNKTVAASMIAEKKVSGQRSYRVATRRQSFRRPNMISMRLRRL